MCNQLCWVTVRERLNRIAWQWSISSNSTHCCTAVSCPSAITKAAQTLKATRAGFYMPAHFSLKWLNLNLNDLLFKDLVTHDTQYEHGDNRSASPFSPLSTPTFITQSMDLQMSPLALPLPLGHNLLRPNHHNFVCCYIPFTFQTALNHCCSTCIAAHKNHPCAAGEDLAPGSEPKPA